MKTISENQTEKMLSEYQADLTRLVRTSQRIALRSAVEKLMQHVDKIDKVLYNETAREILEASRGDNFRNLNEKWIELLKISRTYLEAACIVEEMIKDYR